MQWLAEHLYIGVHSAAAGLENLGNLIGQVRSGENKNLIENL